MSRLSMLIVDDQPVITTMMEHIFAETFTTHTAETGKQALEMCEALLPDIMLLDIGLPDISGAELCRVVKCTQYLKHIKILFISGSEDTREVAAGIAAGGDGFMQKPFRVGEIRQTVSELLAPTS